tara:strand:- start:482 stop:934 length:453 start_codon:yes stop_codon:yes gene_type:complete
MSIKPYAILDSNNIVVNIVNWDGNTSIWQPESGHTAVGIGSTTISFVDDEEASETYGQTITKYSEYESVSIGNTYNNGTWIRPQDSTLDYWKILRYNRDKRLTQSDWKVLPGSPFESKLDEWKTYRQALRDLPANTSDPKKVVYPRRPDP